MTKNIVKSALLFISILSAYLITSYIEIYFYNHRNTINTNPYIVVFVGMLVVTIIYYPLFSKIDKWSSALAKNFLRTGKQLTGKRTGTYIAILLAIAILYYFSMKLWYGIDLIENVNQLLMITKSRYIE